MVLGRWPGRLGCQLGLRGVCSLSDSDGFRVFALGN